MSTIGNPPPDIGSTEQEKRPLPPTPTQKMPETVKIEATHVEELVKLEDLILQDQDENKANSHGSTPVSEHKVYDLDALLEANPDADLDKQIPPDDIDFDALVQRESEVLPKPTDAAKEEKPIETKPRSETIFELPTDKGRVTENPKMAGSTISISGDDSSTEEVAKKKGLKRAAAKAAAKQFIAGIARKIRNVAKKCFAFVSRKEVGLDDGDKPGIASHIKGCKIEVTKGERHVNIDLSALDHFEKTFSAYDAQSGLDEWFEPSPEAHQFDIEEIQQKIDKCPLEIRDNLDENNGNLDMVAVDKDKGISIHLDGTGHTKPFKRAVLAPIFNNLVENITSKGIPFMQQEQELRDISATRQSDFGIDFEGAMSIQQLTRVNNQKAVVSYQIGDLRSFVIDKDGNFSRIPNSAAEFRFPPKPTSDKPCISVTLLNDDDQGVISLSDGVFDSVSEMRLGTIWRSLDNPPQGFLDAVREHIDGLEGKKGPNAKSSFDPHDEKKADDVSFAFLQTGEITPSTKPEKPITVEEMSELLQGQEFTAFYKTGPTAVFGNFSDVPDGIRMEDGKTHIDRWEAEGKKLGGDRAENAKALRVALVSDEKYQHLISEECTETEAIRLGLELEKDYGDLLRDDPAGHQYRNVEAAFQHGKWLHALKETEGSSSSSIQKQRTALEADPLFAKFSTATGDEAFRLSRMLETKHGKLLKLSSESWHNGAKQQVMWSALQSKFTQEPFQSLLEATGDTYLLEHKASERARDNFWSDGGDGTGVNALGRMLQAIRSGEDIPDLVINPTATDYVPDETVQRHAATAVLGLPYSIYDAETVKTKAGKKSPVSKEDTAPPTGSSSPATVQSTSSEPAQPTRGTSFEQLNKSLRTIGSGGLPPKLADLQKKRPTPVERDYLKALDVLESLYRTRDKPSLKGQAEAAKEALEKRNWLLDLAAQLGNWAIQNPEKEVSWAEQDLVGTDTFKILDLKDEDTTRILNQAAKATAAMMQDLE